MSSGRSIEVVPDPSDRARLAQVLDLGRGVAGPVQHLHRVLSDARRKAPQRGFTRPIADRMFQESDVPSLGMLELQYRVEVLNRWFCEDLVVPVDRSTPDALLSERGNPYCSRLRPQDRPQDFGDLFPFGHGQIGRFVW